MTAEELRAIFDAPEPLTIGLEEEVMLTDPRTLEPVPLAAEVVAQGVGKLELPAAQVELVTRPHARVADAVAELRAARHALARATAGRARPLAAAVHPTADYETQLNAGERYAAMAREYATVARRQLVGSLQVHVAVGGADRTLAVYNALRAHLPALAALAAAAPFHAGRDTGLASVRPLICTMLPRQGVPPALESWEHFAAERAWAPERDWWWELRPHVRYGTLELRVPDTQPTIEHAGAVAATAHALVAWLAARHDAGEALGAPATWRIAENRWSALRHGVEGVLLDYETGAPRATRAVLRALLDAIEPHAQLPLDAARAQVEANPAIRLRRVGLAGASSWLADAFAG